MVFLGFGCVQENKYVFVFSEWNDAENKSVCNASEGVSYG
jgi:hypothetical protein